jgi:hypothetical protein
MLRLSSDRDLAVLPALRGPRLHIMVSAGVDLARLGALLASLQASTLLLSIKHTGGEPLVEGCSALIAAALQNPRLRVLHADGNFDWPHEALICEALARNTTLTTFELSSSYIADLAPFAAALTINRTLEQFALRSVEIEEPDPLFGLRLAALKSVELDVFFSEAEGLEVLRRVFNYCPVISQIIAHYGPETFIEVFSR